MRVSQTAGVQNKIKKAWLSVRSVKREGIPEGEVL